MARSRSTSSSRPNRDASRLAGLALALNQSGSRVEDRYWEGLLAAAIPKLLRAGNDAPLEAALDQLSQADTGAYEVLIEQAETLSESTVLEKDGQRHDVLLIVAPIVAWTRYTIPANPIPPAALDALRAQLHGHVLANDARLALLPRLVSIDQMPRSFSDTWQWLHRLGAQALELSTPKPALPPEAETANMLADTRYVVGAVAVPENAPMFRWQESHDDQGTGRKACLAQWAEQAQPTLAALLPGCGFECLLPDAYYVSNREADRRVRPLSLRAAVSWLESTLGMEPSQLRAVVAGCGESRVDEYRVGFTPRNRNDVIYGCVWPLYGREEDPAAADIDDPQPDTPDEIAAILKEQGVTEIRRLPGLLPPDFCEDCGTPYFPNPLGEMVHAELPEDADATPSHFH